MSVGRAHTRSRSSLSSDQRPPHHCWPAGDLRVSVPAPLNPSRWRFYSCWPISWQGEDESAGVGLLAAPVCRFLRPMRPVCSAWRLLIHSELPLEAAISLLRPPPCQLRRSCITAVNALLVVASAAPAAVIQHHWGSPIALSQWISSATPADQSLLSRKKSVFIVFFFLGCRRRRLGGRSILALGLGGGGGVASLASALAPQSFSHRISLLLSRRN